MKNLMITAIALLSFGALANVNIVEKDMVVKVASIEATVKCIETALDSISSCVLTNQVDHAGTYKVRLLILTKK